MTVLDLELSADLIETVKRLARESHGTDDEDAVSQTVEAALWMRLLWEALETRGGGAVEEPIVTWAVEQESSAPDDLSDLLTWLFREE